MTSSAEVGVSGPGGGARRAAEADVHAGPGCSRSSVVLGLAVFLLGWALPYFAHTTWSDVWAVLQGIPATTAFGLFLLMVLGLWLYTFTITGSLPHLPHVKAFIVNVSGSAVGNLLPAGGAAGAAATYAAPLVGLHAPGDLDVADRHRRVEHHGAAAAADHRHRPDDLLRRRPPRGDRAAAVGAVGGMRFSACSSPCWRPSGPRRPSAGVDRCRRSAVRRRRSRDELERHPRPAPPDHRRGAPRLAVDDLRHGRVLRDELPAVLVLPEHGRRPVALPYMFFAFALSRLLTSVTVTPGGVGVSETGVAALLVGWGANPAQATAGVRSVLALRPLPRGPARALGWLAWGLSRKPQPPDPAAAPGPGGSPRGDSADPAPRRPRRARPGQALDDRAGHTPGQRTPAEGGSAGEPPDLAQPRLVGDGVVRSPGSNGRAGGQLGGQRDQRVGEAGVRREDRAVQVGADDVAGDGALGAGRCRCCRDPTRTVPNGCWPAPSTVEPEWFS